MYRLHTLKVIVAIISKLHFSTSKYIDDDSLTNHLWTDNDHDIVILAEDKHGTVLRTNINNEQKTEDDIPIDVLKGDPNGAYLNDALSKAVRRELSSHTPRDSKHIVKEDRKAKFINRAEQKRLAEHQARLAFIRDFIADRPLTTKYVNQEIHRIKKTGVVKDELRKMVRVLEKPKVKTREKVIECYTFFREKIPRPVHEVEWDIYNTNNNVIHTVRDPMNDGVV